jgi:O-antigen ligase
METQQSIIDKRETDVPGLLVANKRNDLLLFMVIVIVIFSLTPVLILTGAAVGYSVLLGCLAALTVAVLVVRWPTFGFFVTVVCAVLIEQNPLNTAHILTDALYVYYWPTSLAGLIERPIGFLLILIIFAFVCRQFVKRQGFLQGGALLGPFVFFLLCVAWGVVHGVTTGGDFKTIVLEVRPFLYLFESYLLAYNLVTHKNHIKAFLWVMIVAAGVKGIQGCYIYYIVLHRSLLGQNEIMAHEDSFFFAALILLVILFSIHYNYRPQVFAALIALPGVVITLIANERRADYVALLVGFIVAWTLIYCVKKHARKALLTGMITFLVFGAAYVALFAHSSGGVASPARAVISIINPNSADVRDASSNLYRTIEDFDLKYTAKQDAVLGYGFGKEFLQPKTLPNILYEDPIYLLVPHNTIYWIWMRLGTVGYFAFWFLLGSIIVRGCQIVRRLQDRYLQLVAIYIVAVTFMEVVVAYADYQLFFYRNVIYLGLLVGILLKLPKLDLKPEVDRSEKGAPCT